MVMDFDLLMIEVFGGFMMDVVLMCADGPPKTL